MVTLGPLVLIGLLCVTFYFGSRRGKPRNDTAQEGRGGHGGSTPPLPPNGERTTQDSVDTANSRVEAGTGAACAACPLPASEQTEASPPVAPPRRPHPAALKHQKKQSTRLFIDEGAPEADANEVPPKHQHCCVGLT